MELADLPNELLLKVFKISKRVRRLSQTSVLFYEIYNENIMGILKNTCNRLYFIDRLTISSRKGSTSAVKTVLKLWDLVYPVDDSGKKNKARIYNIGIALGEAAKKGHIETCNFLLGKGVDSRARDAALEWAAYYNHIETVRVILEAGANVNFRDTQGLQWAAKHGYLELVGILLDAGAHVEANNNYALRASIHENHLEIVEILLDNGANLQALTDVRWKYIYENSSIEMLRFLQEKSGRA